MSKIFITGSKGQLGNELIKQLKINGYNQLILTDVDNLDITNIDAVWNIVSEQKPDIIINCAAYTAVDQCETDIDNAYRVNAIGPRNLAIASNEIKAKMIHISTDYVFDGESSKPYTEFDTPNPKTIYGRTKLEGEKFVQQINPRSFIIRTAWMYGEGNNFIRTILKLAKKLNSIKVVNDQYGSPTSTEEVVKMIAALMHTKNYGLFHGTCEGQCTWYELAKEVFKFTNTNIDVIPVTSEEFPRPAARPKYSVLNNYMLDLTTNYKFSYWKESLKKYLQ